MNKFEKPGRWKRYILPVLLLLVVCVGSVELWVCSFKAPDVYAAITAPVRTAVRQVGDASELAWNALRQQASRAVADGTAQVRAGLRRLNEYFTRKPEPEELPEEEGQLVDGTEVAPPPNPQASYSVTAKTVRDGQEYLTGGSYDLVYYDQDYWAKDLYGTDPIGSYGCGPTAMAIVVSTLTQTEVDPVEMAQLCVKKGYWAKGHGSYWSIVPGIAKEFGLECTSLPPGEADRIVHTLATGHLVVAMMGPGHFTNNGHFIVLRGLTLDGSILVADSASPDRSLTLWDLDLILEELSPKRSSGGPLWAISAEEP